MGKKKTRSKRSVLLTLKERHLLDETEIRSQRRKKLFPKLEKKLEGLAKDLEIITKSGALEDWRYYLCLNKFDTILRLQKAVEILIIPEPRYIFLDKIRSAKKGRKRVFWVDQPKISHNELKNRVHVRKKSKNFKITIRDLKAQKLLGGFKEGYLKSLCHMAYQYNVLPSKKKNAITKKEIEKRLEKIGVLPIKDRLISKLMMEGGSDELACVKEINQLHTLLISINDRIGDYGRFRIRSTPPIAQTLLPDETWSDKRGAGYLVLSPDLKDTKLRPWPTMKPRRKKSVNFSSMS